MEFLVKGKILIIHVLSSIGAPEIAYLAEIMARFELRERERERERERRKVILANLSPWKV